MHNDPSIVATISVCTLLNVILIVRSHAILLGTSFKCGFLRDYEKNMPTCSLRNSLLLGAQS
jgi:hypothetical protein